ncbi:hypothetical protein Tco_0900449 [Tanacetum coccineum]
MDSEVVKSSVTRTEGSSKRARDELESIKSKKQKIDEHVEAEKDDDQEEAEIKKHIEMLSKIYSSGINKIILDVVGTSGYRCEVLRSFPVEIIEQGNE